MEEIKVGEYIRTKDGCIFKATEYWLGECYSDRVNIKKHSPNIINLIEEGDYVNGSEVVAEKYKNYDMNFINVDSKISFGWGYGVIPENDIKSIVTKERFESESYRLEE